VENPSTTVSALTEGLTLAALAAPKAMLRLVPAPPRMFNCVFSLDPVPHTDEFNARFHRLPTHATAYPFQGDLNDDLEALS